MKDPVAFNHSFNKTTARLTQKIQELEELVLKLNTAAEFSRLAFEKQISDLQAEIDQLKSRKKKQVVEDAS
jgi:hypothetical protein